MGNLNGLLHIYRCNDIQQNDTSIRAFSIMTLVMVALMAPPPQIISECYAECDCTNLALSDLALKLINNPHYTQHYDTLHNDT